MFGFSITRIFIYLAIIAGIVGYFMYTQNQLAFLNQQVAAKDFALKTTTETLKKTQEDLVQQQKIAAEADANYQAARQEANEIQEKFTKNGRDLSAFAQSKPSEVQKRMNDATAKSFRCIEETVNKGNANVPGC